MMAFHFAKPIWLAGREREMNVTAGFRAVVNDAASGRTLLRITTSGLYRAYVNGEFAGHGPARSAHGFYRIDQWDIMKLMKPGANLIAIEVNAANVNSYYLLNQPGFLQAEIVANDEALAYTSDDAAHFSAVEVRERVQRIQRYSFQRTFVEYYRMNVRSNDWKLKTEAIFDLASIAESASKDYLARRVSYPAFVVREPELLLAEGRSSSGHVPAEYWRDRSLVGIGPAFRGYQMDELELVVSDELQRWKTVSLVSLNRSYRTAESRQLKQGEFFVYDFGKNLTGFVGMRLRVPAAVKLYVTFDEILTANSDIDEKRLACVNAIGYELEAGDYELESIEPYTMRYAKWLVVSGEAEIAAVWIRELANPDTVYASFRSDRDALNRIFTAGVETFRQNALDIYMDCPSRERAGWLCDSYFTSRVEYELTGASAIETNFLENYVMPQSFAYLPNGMLPMCYPADHDDGVFIPNWALWFVIELEEFAVRAREDRLVQGAKASVERLFAYFDGFLNEDGLLEDLQSWIFIEWSKANEFVSGVNYPSNMLYAGALAAAGRLYGEERWLEQAERVRETIRVQSYNGSFFRDQAVRAEDGTLAPGPEMTEVCQYYAFTFDIALPSSHPKLWNRLVGEFGPTREQEHTYPDIYPANAFIGNYLRLDLLSRYGLGEKALRQAEDYFLNMADKTGTLWEHAQDEASCNHGFASYAVHWLLKEGLGIRQLDHLEQRVELCFAPSFLTRCEGALPAGDDLLRIRWHLDGSSLIYAVGGDHGYTVDIMPVEGYKLIRENWD